jgi:hypothetical protein
MAKALPGYASAASTGPVGLSETSVAVPAAHVHPVEDVADAGGEVEVSVQDRSAP